MGLISDGGQGGDDHVEAIEPRPALDIVKAQRADANHEGQRGREEFKIAESPHGSVPGGTGNPVSRATSEYSSGRRGAP